jgi:hypothetical protein
MSDLLAGSEWWFLERFHYEGALLEVDIAEGIISAVSADVSLDKGLSIKGASPIEITEKSKHVRIQFPHVLAHQITDESYCAPETGSTKEIGGRILCQHTDSAYLEYVIKNSLIDDLVDDSVCHYSLNLADDIIDVITTSNPSIELI